MGNLWPLIWFGVSTFPMVGISLLANVIGIFIVPFAIPFAKTKTSRTSGREILTYGGVFWLWGNDGDGLLGDKRGAWDTIWLEVWFPKLKWLQFSGLVTPKTTCYVAKYIWAALRNPANNVRFTSLFSCDVEKCSTIKWIGDKVVSDRVNNAGLQFVWAYRKHGVFPYCGFYWVKMLGQKQEKCVRVRVGFKLTPGDVDGLVGFCFSVSPYKHVHQ